MHRRIGLKLRHLFAFFGDDRGLSALLGLLIVNFFLLPLLSPGLARLLSAVVFSLMFLSGVVNISGRRVVRVFAGVVVALAVCLRWLEQVFPHPAIDAAATVATLVFLVLLTGQVLRRVFRAGPVTAHRVQGAVAAYFLLALCWAFVYQLIDLSQAGAFNFPAAEASLRRHDPTLTYFSFITITTLGYGDVTPVHPIARMFVILEALTGQLYPATLLARLVSLEIMYRETHPRESARAEPADAAPAQLPDRKG